jgi:hypothetical protein
LKRLLESVGLKRRPKQVDDLDLSTYLRKNYGVGNASDDAEAAE